MKARQGLWAAVFLLLAVTASCTTILGIDHVYKEAEAGVACADPLMCDDQDPCSVDTCENGLCAHMCKTSCASDADCASAFYCGGSSCVAKKVNGASCGGPSQCQSGNCVDGVCCSSASCPTCQSCAMGGTCTNIAAGQPDNNPPGACTTQCDGNGNCL